MMRYIFIGLFLLFGFFKLEAVTTFSWNDGTGIQLWDKPFPTNWLPNNDFPDAFDAEAVFSIGAPASSISLDLHSNDIQLNGFTQFYAQELSVFTSSSHTMTFGGDSAGIILAAAASSVHFNIPLILSINPLQALTIESNNPASTIYFKSFTGTGNLSFSGGGNVEINPDVGVSSTFSGDVDIDTCKLYYKNPGAFPIHCSVTTQNLGELHINPTIPLTEANIFDVTLLTGGQLFVDSDLYLRNFSADNTTKITLSAIQGVLLQLQPDIVLPPLSQNISGQFLGGVASLSPDWTSGSRIILTNAGTFQFNANNTGCVSRIFIEEGSTLQALTIQSLGASGSTSPLFVRSGGVVELKASNLTNTYAKDFLLNGSGFNNNGALRSIQTNNVISGNVQIGWANGSLETPEDVLLYIGQDSLTLSGVLSGVNNLSFFGNGNLTISGVTPNSFAGTTTLNANTLTLSKALGPALGSITVNGGALLFNGTNQLAPFANLTINAGNVDFQNNNQAFSSLYDLGGNCSLGTGQLTLSSNATALKMKNTTLNGTIQLTGSGDITFDASTQGMAKIMGSLDLGNLPHTFQVANATSLVDMEVDATCTSTSSITKKGDGTLKFTNTVNVANTLIEQGTLIVDALFTSPSVNVSPQTTLGGIGTILGNLAVGGTLAPGESIGTMTVSGNVVFQNNSQFVVEVSPTAVDLLNVIGGGNVTIAPGSTLFIKPQKTSYPNFFQVTVINAPGGVQGYFTTLKNLTPLFKVAYFPTHVDIIARRLLAADVIGKNPGAVAGCFDSITPVPQSDMENVIEHLDDIFNIPLLRSYLNTMHPAIFKNMALAAQKNSFCFRKVISDRMHAYFNEPAVWLDVFSDLSYKKTEGELFGYKHFCPAGLLGADGTIFDRINLGIALGYGYSDVRFYQNQGKAQINTIFGALYASAYKDKMFFQGILSSGYNFFKKHRKINSSFDLREAKSKNSGFDLGVYFSMGTSVNWGRVEIKPYLAIDNAYVDESGYTESGAFDLNLHVHNSFYNACKGEIGAHFSLPCGWRSFNFIPDLKLSIIKPWRHGSDYTANFVNYPDHTYKVHGLDPSQILFSPELTLTALSEGSFAMQLGYNAEFHKRYQNHLIHLEFNASF